MKTTEVKQNMVGHYEWDTNMKRRTLLKTVGGFFAAVGIGKAVDAAPVDVPDIVEAEPPKISLLTAAHWDKQFFAEYMNESKFKSADSVMVKGTRPRTGTA